jgi:hypothetical protein
MRLRPITIRGWMMTVGASAIVMVSLSFDIDRTPDATSAVLSLNLNRLMAWTAIIIPVLVPRQRRRLPCH